MSVITYMILILKARFDSPLDFQLVNSLQDCFSAYKIVYYLSNLFSVKLSSVLCHHLQKYPTELNTLH